MSILILPIAGFAVFNFFYGRNEAVYGFFSRVRLAFVQMLLAGGLAVYASTETLSSINSLNYPSIAVFWSVITLVFGYFNFKRNYWILSYSDFLKAGRLLSRNEKILFYFVCLVYLIPLLFLAVYAPPNNTDSVNYHLARVVFWLQNQNVEHFPTVYIQQLYHNVFSEYILLHIMALNGWNDYFVNLVQWLAMLGSVCAIGLVGKLLGFGRRIQLFLSVLQLTLPIGILESTTTQNDYIANFLFLAFLYFGLRLVQIKKPKSVNSESGTVPILTPKSGRNPFSFPGERAKDRGVFWLALALALGGFNKYTVFLFGFPLCVWIGVELLKNYPFKFSLRVFFVALGMLVLVFTPFFKRNYDLFGNVLSSTKGSPLFTEEVATEQKCIGCVASVALKNLIAHLGLPFQSYNQQIDQGVATIHQWLGVPLNGPELNVDAYYTRFVIQEDMSHNPWHFLLIFIGAIWLIFQKKHRDFKLLLICAVTGFVLFSALIKYQIYNTRVIMPFFSMGFLWTGVMMSQLDKKWRMGVIGAFLLAGLPYVYTNYNKGLLPMRQLSKYVLGYIPPFLCIKDGNEVPYQRKFNEIYDFNKGMPCYPLKASPTYWQRLELISQLKDLGYYKTEEQSFLEKTREENYFTEMYDLGLYGELKQISSHLSPNTKGIGVLFGNVLGFYREWLLIKNQLNHAVPMQYILYQEHCRETPNAKRLFVYDYILLDHPELIEKYLDKSRIEATISTKHYILVKLKKPATHRYTYISRAEVEEYETRY
jgi:hypothetical protein